jgi:transposase InsO family protein
LERGAQNAHLADIPAFPTLHNSELITTNITVFYNRRRRHSTLGYCPPTQFLQDWISKHHQQILAA